ncbi:MAG: serine/threonine protein kinase, partial [Chloroflexi bacterium]|nr:serine/threonine protein kinase [Chloroflexota bacterium]
MADELIGKQIGQYEITMVLGKGGMSTVYLGRQASVDRAVAIKVLPRTFLHDDTFLIRFREEIRTVTSLEHPHILPVYDAGEADGIPYIVMRYVSGGTLSDLLMRGLPPVETVLRVVEHIASALDYAGEHGIIHRDLKPSNILLDKDGNAYLTDFGVARTSYYEGGLTGSRVIGTPPYIAPEAIRKDDAVTGLADQYALGVLAYEMLCGHPPYQSDDPMKVLVAHVLEPIPSLREANPNISPAVDSVVRRCLAKFPQQRSPSSLAFASALARAFDSTQPGANAPLPDEVMDTQPSEVLPRPKEVETVKRISGEDLAAARVVEQPRPAAEQAGTAPPARKRRRDGAGLSCLIPIGVVIAMGIG